MPLTALATATAAGLTVLSAIHVVWALGFAWPFAEEARLTRTVFNLRPGAPMPGAAPLSLIAVVLLFAAATALWLAGPHGVGVTLLGAVFAALFLARGVGTYLRRGQTAEPFGTLDRRIYAPAALALALSFAVLILAG